MISDNNDRIVIENTKDMQFFCSFILFATPALFAIMYFDSHSLLAALFVTSPCLIGIIPGIAEAKRITLDKNGCMVEILLLNKFVVYKKIYKWEEFVERRIADCSKICRESKYGFPYEKVVAMSMIKIKKPKYIRFDNYAELHPLSVHYFYFARYGVKNLSIAKSYKSYETDEALFREKIAEWGVVFDEDDI